MHGFKSWGCILSDFEIQRRKVDFHKRVKGNFINVSVARDALVVSRKQPHTTGSGDRCTWSLLTAAPQDRKATGMDTYGMAGPEDLHIPSVSHEAWTCSIGRRRRRAWDGNDVSVTCQPLPPTSFSDLIRGLARLHQECFFSETRTDRAAGSPWVTNLFFPCTPRRALLSWLVGDYIEYIYVSQHHAMHVFNNFHVVLYRLQVITLHFSMCIIFVVHLNITYI